MPVNIPVIKPFPRHYLAATPSKMLTVTTDGSLVNAVAWVEYFVNTDTEFVLPDAELHELGDRIDIVQVTNVATITYQGQVWVADASSGDGTVSSRVVFKVVEVDDIKVWTLITSSGNIDLSTYVSIGGSQTITGSKTFQASPVVPTPTLDTQAINKGAVVSLIAAAISGVKPVYVPITGTTQTGTESSLTQSLAVVANPTFTYDLTKFVGVAYNVTKLLGVYVKVGVGLAWDSPAITNAVKALYPDGAYHTLVSRYSTGAGSDESSTTVLTAFVPLAPGATVLTLSLDVGAVGTNSQANFTIEAVSQIP